MNKFMIFYKEATGEHYLHNGEDTINIMPGEKTVWDAAEDKKSELAAAYNSPKKKIFTVNKTRYVVVFRNKFQEP